MKWTKIGSLVPNMVETTLNFGLTSGKSMELAAEWVNSLTSNKVSTSTLNLLTIARAVLRPANCALTPTLTLFRAKSFSNSKYAHTLQLGTILFSSEERI